MTYDHYDEYPSAGRNLRRMLIGQPIVREDGSTVTIDCVRGLSVGVDVNGLWCGVSCVLSGGEEVCLYADGSVCFALDDTGFGSHTIRSLGTQAVTS